MSIKNIFNFFNFFEKINKWLDKTINIKRTSAGIEEDIVSTYKDLGIKLILFISLLAFLSFLFPSGISFQYANLKTGMIAPEKIEAPFTFPILKTEEEFKELLGIPQEKRLLTLIPVGVPAEWPTKEKKMLEEVLHWERY